MNTLTHLLKDRDVGMWCKRAAWIIVAFDLINIVLNVYSTLPQYNTTGAGVVVTTAVLAQAFRFALSFVPSMLFSFFILYAAGVLVDHFVGGEDDTDEVEEDINEDEVPIRARASR
jgi:hypothetical protein